MLGFGKPPKSKSKRGRSLQKREEILLSGKEKGVQKKPAEGVKGLFQDSQVHQMKLKMQNAATSEFTQRKQVEEALRNSETRLRQSSQLIMAHEGERRRLSQELDNSILSKLSAIPCALEKKIIPLGKEFSPERLELENLRSIAQQATEDTPRIMTNLYPSVLDNRGLVAGLNLFLAK
jgi:signal transduction histidine kinase